jgi:uncharacterized protein (TIGR03437 family)
MKRTVLRTFLVGAALVGQALAQPVLNDVPSRVVGQPSLDFRSGNPNVVESRSLFNPLAVVTDRTSTPQALYVSDFGNNRVLGWRNATTFANGAPADIVIGQLDFVSTSPLGPGSSRATGVAFPGAMAVDSQGNLYVADLANNRILRFPKPFANADDVKAPDMVIGQPNFTSEAANQGGLSEKGLAFNSGSVRTSGLAFDPQGNLWVTDPGNNRVLRYPAAALTAGTNQPAADLVLGQPNFTTNAAPAATAANRTNKAVMASPSGIAIDPQGNVFVADAISRVLVFSPQFFNGKEASRLLGLAVLPPGEGFTNATNVLNPEGVFMVGDRPGVTDTGLHRIVIFDALKDWPAETEQQPSPPARIVIGQADFTSNRSNRQGAEASAQSVSGPQSAYFNGSELFVADTGNNRILVFPQVVSNATATRVLGQVNFNFNGANLVEGTELFIYNGVSDTSNLSGNFSDGAGIALDSRATPPRLYVADTFNNRILGYRDARRVKQGDKADIIIGQADFNRTLVNAPQNNRDIQTDLGLFRPSGLAVDSNGDLFVADSGNGRVVRFASPFEKVPAAGERYRTNLVIGQANAFSRLTDPGPRNMAYPFGVAFTVEGHLLVSDAVHNRVLFFRRPSGGDFTTGMAAEKVIGQPDFFTGTRGSGNNRLFSPRHIAIDTDDRLYVTDAGNNRIVMYDRIPSAANDPAPAFSLGGVTAPQGIFVSQTTGEIWVANTRGNRLSRYPRFALLPITTSAEQNIASAAPLAVVQDPSGNLFVAEGTNRVAMYFNGLAYQVAGNFAERPISPGGIAILYPRTQANRRFTSETKSFNELPNPLPLPRELADTQVLLNDQPVPLYFVSPSQINFLVPMNTQDSGRADVQVVRPSTGEVIAATTIDVAKVSPALFIQGNSAEGQIAALNTDNSVNSAANPAAKLSVIQLFGTGQGFVRNAPADGNVATGELQTDEKPIVLMGTRFVESSDVLYSGLAPGLVGVWQINVRIPDFVAPGTVDVVVQLQSVPSNIGPGGRRVRTTIAVKP